MKIGIDYTSAAKQRAGIGRLTRELVAGLARLDRDNAYILFEPRSGRYTEEPDLPSNFRRRVLPLTERQAVLLWHRLGAPLPVEAFGGRLDLYHATDFALPPLWRAASVLTVHDLTFVAHPECTQPGLIRYLERVVPRSVARADMVVADSECTRRDLIAWLGTASDKVEVIYGGVGQPFAPVTDEARSADIRARYGAEPPFILTLGTMEPRKNWGRLVDAFGIFKERTGLPHRLVLAGGRGWLYGEIMDKVQRLVSAGHAVLTGFVADEDLPALLMQADVFVYPSLYEGFGLPILEAMACGIPVVASNASCLPEVAGDAALLVDPTDVEGMAVAMERLVSDRELHAQMRDAGLRQAERFSWDASAEKLLGIYRRVGGR